MKIKVVGLACFVISLAFAFAAPFAGDGLSDFLVGDTSKKIVVKRQISEDNIDRQLKQISLSSLVSDVENNILASALSLHDALMNKNVSVSELKIEDDSKVDVNNDHQSTIKQEKTSTIQTKEASANLPVSNKVIVQSIEKVPSTKDEPAHLVIDRITIQPHKGILTSIPIFEVKRTVEEKPEDKEAGIAAPKSATTTSPFITSIPPNTNESTLNSVTAATTTATTEAVLKSVTTLKNIEELKEAEEELKEKFAEIEADPIILSARV